MKCEHCRGRIFADRELGNVVTLKCLNCGREPSAPAAPAPAAPAPAPAHAPQLYYGCICGQRFPTLAGWSLHRGRCSVYALAEQKQAKARRAGRGGTIAVRVCGRTAPALRAGARREHVEQ